jgi:hypothetical protein
MKTNFFTLVLIICAFIPIGLFSQNKFTDEDLRNYPHWFDMMQKDYPNYNEVKRAYDLYFEKHKKERGTLWKVFERWAWQYKGDFEPDGTLLPDKIIQAYQKYKKSNILRGPSTNAGNWEELGPFVYPINVSGQETGTGRVNALAFDPVDQDVIWVGAPSGGLWKSDDGGDTYSSSTDQMPTLGVSSILINPSNSNIMYIGTGDRDAGSAPGLGVYKSVDGGANWTLSNSGMGNLTVGEMLFQPGNSNIIIAATSGGIYKSTDSGATWVRKSSNTDHYKDIAYHPTNTNYLYATASGSFYRSIDSGETWTQISSGLISCSRMIIGVSVAQPDWVYCLLTGGSQLFHGIFKSTDSGANFTRITPANHPNILGYNDGDDKSQAWYDLCMIINPTNANQILVGSVCIHRSDNGGTSFTKKAHWSTQVHADQHVVALNTLNNRIYEGHDGGLHYSDDYFDTYTNISGGLRIGQTYKIGQAAYDKELVINGYQDNGTSIVDNGVFYTVAGGDGMESAFDYSDPDYVYTTYISTIKRSSTRGFGGWSTIASENVNGITESGAWVTPYSLHVTDPNTMFFGYKNIWRSNNVKSNPPTWTKISNNLAGTNSYNFLYTDQSHADINIFYAVREDNKLFRSDNVNDANPVWNDMTSKLPNGTSNIDDVICHPTDPEIVYILQSEKIYKSGDRGNTWTNISGTIPSETNLNCIEIDKYSNEGIYIGTKTGVFFKNSSMSDWIAFDGGLPVVDVREMDIYYGGTESKLRAGTYGRGLWETSLYDDGTHAPIANFRADKTTASINETISLEDLSSNQPDTWTWNITPANFTFENGTDANSQHPDVSFTANGVYTVSLTAANINGSDSKTINSYIQIINVVSPSCIPVTQNLSYYGMGIKNVTLNTINKTSGQPVDDSANGYLDLIDTDYTILNSGTQYSLNVELFTNYTEYWKFYIDYNNDGDFLDANEEIYSSPTKVSGILQRNFTTISNPPLNQLLRMRVICDYFSISGPCYNPSYGQAEDYGIIFKDLPVLTTLLPSNITYNSAESGGNISSQGSSAIIKRGIVWDIRENPTIDKNWGYTENGTGIGSFVSLLTGLSPNTTYYVRSYAINSDGIEYGQNASFTTSFQPPVLTTNNISGISGISATSGGNISSDNGNPVSLRGIVWSTNSNPNLGNCNGSTQNGSGTGSFSSNLNGLSPGTVYYVKAYARNGFTTAYGDAKSFTTLAPDPNQSNNLTFTDVGINKITVNWINGTGQKRIVKINNINNFNLPIDGTDPSANSVYSGGEQVIYNGAGNSVTVTNLNSSTIYYFIVFDYNGSGTGTIYNIAPGLNNPSAHSTLCLPPYTNSNLGTYLKGLTLNTINNLNNGGDGNVHYTNFTNLSTNLLVGQTYTVGFQMSYNPEFVNLWIDWNDNSLFESNEKFVSDLNCTQNQTTNANITIPSNATLGSHIMRARATWGSGYDPCNQGSYGETEDYSVRFTDEISWTGTTSTDWFTITNWDVRKVPTILDKVVINTAGNQPVIGIGLTGNAKKVTAKSGTNLQVFGTLNVKE